MARIKLFFLPSFYFSISIDVLWWKMKKFHIAAPFTTRPFRVPHFCRIIPFETTGAFFLIFLSLSLSIRPPFVLSMTRRHFMVGRAFSLIVARLLCIIMSSSSHLSLLKKISFDIIPDASESPKDYYRPIPKRISRHFRVRMSWCCVMTIVIWMTLGTEIKENIAQRTTSVILDVACKLHTISGDHKTSK